MKNKKETLLILTILITICIIIFNRDKLYEAKYIEPKDTLLAITINGEISTTFPTTNAYTGTVECTTGTGKVEWNGTKWVLTTSGITKGSTKCNATFITKVPTFAETILANNEVKTPITTPGAAISTASEALLASTEDDNGTSYYFRGAVKNNYVQFANKCWRIVRVGGDGSVKLILHNDNKAGVANPCDAANNSDSAAFARYSGTTYTSAFNTNYNDNTYVGFMYGQAGASDYATTHANTNKSTILNNLEIWYNNNLKTYESLIDNNVFCNDKGRTGIWPGYGTELTFYDSGTRLSTSGTPSLKCNGNLSKITGKVGLITADEAAFAGFKTTGNVSLNYLLENTGNALWWTMTPAGFYGDAAQVWAILSGLRSMLQFSVDNENGFRPYISLKASASISGGSGTSEDPYVVK